jgi:two-component system, sensor histidine kinase and response regulator
MRHGQSEEPPNADLAPDHAEIDLDAALQRLGGDEQLLRDMALMFVQDAPGLLEQAHMAGRAGDADAPWRAAHSLKGLASNFSEPAAAAAQRAETALHEGDPGEIAAALADLRAQVERLVDGLKRRVLR